VRPIPTCASSSSTRAQRDRRPSPISTCRSSRAPTSRCTTACCTSCSARGWSIGTTSPPYRGLRRARTTVAAYPPAVVAEICGLAEADIIRPDAGSAAPVRPVAVLPGSQPVGSHGTHNNAALIHLHLATGQIGRPGAGPFSLTGQPNAMGGREVGGLANLLSAHRDLANPDTAPRWPACGACHRSRATRQDRHRTLCRAQRGLIKAVWIACTNPAQSLPDQAEVRAALQAATSSSSRKPTATPTPPLTPTCCCRPHLGRKGRNGDQLRAPDHAPRAGGQPAGRSASRLADRRRLRAPPRRATGAAADRKLFPYEHPEQIFNEHRESTRGRDLDITGLSYALLDAAARSSGRFPEGASSGRQRLYEDGVFPTASGRARFVKVEHQPTAETPTPRARSACSPAVCATSGTA
jgi:assimilatory nitrate reductase catalytic subunit